MATDPRFLSAIFKSDRISYLFRMRSHLFYVPSSNTIQSEKFRYVGTRHD
ncbi:hypothetical protein [Floridanema aerugineum]|uniref:Uncharacterized protein n=1 Tax=Floridaenema aerugineum BLCC-F46 TaxID=3153654 RepID=A0ABV4WZJ7_9CYAN